MKIIHGDCLEELKELPENSIDSIVTDPPYGLSFMGKKWDYDVPSEEVWKECLRVLKPGGHLLSFAGTRTQHRMAVRIEDAGFEIRDMIGWVYGCLSEDTEILTANGWKMLYSVFEGDYVFACDYKNDMKLQLEPVKQKFIYDYDEDAYHIKDTGYYNSELMETDHIVSKNHNVLVLESWVRNAGFGNNLYWEKIPAEKLYENIQKIGGKKTFRIPGLNGDIPCTIKKIPYKGKVWCVEVESGAFVARRKGKIFITGNSGFPKSLNIGKALDKREGVEHPKNTPISSNGSMSGANYTRNKMAVQSELGKQWEGWGTALKPALEPITVARKPLSEKTVAENVLTHGTGGLNIDESRVISYTTAYNDGDNNDCTLQEHTVLEIRHKICSEPPFSLSESLELSRLSSDDEYGQKWYKQRDYSDDCSSCRRLYDALLPLFLKGDQVSVQQLHDVLADIDRLRTEEKHNLSSQDIDLPSSLDDFYQLILSYLNDTTLILNRQEKITLNLNKKGEQLFNEGDVKKAKWSGDSEERTGRFPANLIHDGSEEVVGLFPNSSGGAFPKKHGSSGFVSPEERESRIEMKDSGSAARFFKECKPDILCYLCNCTIDDKHGKMSVINSNLCSKDAKTVERILSQDITTITSDSVVPFVLHDIQLKNEGKEAQSQSHARNVEKSSPVSQATTESIAQTNAEDLEEKQAVQNAKSAGNLCDLCATSIVQSIVAMKQGQDPALPLGLVSTSERKKQILTKCLASYVAALGNTDTILTTGSLSLFFGFVRDAIENTTSRERSEQKGSSEQSQQRLRYCSKASKKDRDEGLEGFEEKNNMRVNAPRESEEEKLSTMTKNFHPTVKPTALMRYLVKLVTPPGGTVLDPFTGSGSTGKACKLEGFEFIGIEREEEYVKIAEARIAAVTHQPTLV